MKYVLQFFICLTLFCGCAKQLRLNVKVLIQTIAETEIISVVVISRTVFINSGICLTRTF